MSILAVTSQRDMRDKTEQETRYFISSLDNNDPKQLIKAVRTHWSIENKLHWVLLLMRALTTHAPAQCR